MTNWQTPDDVVDAVLDVARGELGYTEGPNNANKYSSALGRPGEPWCDDFASWVFDELGLMEAPWKDNAAYVPYTIDWYRKLQQTGGPIEAGDVLCLAEYSGGRWVQGAHIGIVESVVNQSEVIYISGNTSDPRGGASRPDGNEQEGWGVFRRLHVLNTELDVYCHPDYQAALAAQDAPTPVTSPAAPFVDRWPDDLPRISASALGQIMFGGDSNPHSSLNTVALALNYAGCGPVPMPSNPMACSPSLCGAWNHWAGRSGASAGAVTLPLLTGLAQQFKQRPGANQLFHAIP